MDKQTSDSLKHDPRANSVENLSELYTVVIGVALAIAMSKIVDEHSTPAN